MSHRNRLDQVYSLSDDGFREAVVIDDSKGGRLPACFPEQYGDEYEASLILEADKKTDAHEHHVHGDDGGKPMKFPYAPEV